MIKKIMTLAIALLLTAGIATQAQEGNNALYGHSTKGGAKNISFPASDIQFWTGQGTNQAVVILAWDDDPNGNDLALAWGVRWNGSAMATDLLDSIAAYDSRFSYTVSGSLMTNMTYNDGTVNPQSSMNGWCYYHNGDWGMNAWPNEPVANNDVIEMSSSCSWTMTSAVAATDPNGGSNTDPVDATIDFDSIIYWVGTGSNEAAFIISFAEPDTALAWGFRYNQATIQDMMDALSAADPRLTIVGNPSYMGDMYFVNAPGDTLRLSPVDPNIGYNFWWTNLNGLSVASYTTPLQDGDYFKFGDLNSATGWDLQGGYYMQEAWTTEVHPVSVPGSDPVEPTPEDAEIAASDIIYWVGEGTNKVVFAINWADTALAWGYKFSSDSVYVSEIIGALVAADPRLSIEGDSTFVSDFHYADANITDTLGITPHDPSDYSIYFNMQVNHVSSMVGAAGHAVVNGDFVKFADTYVAVKADSTWVPDWGGYWDYTYVWPMAIHPVSVPSTSRIDAVSAGSLAVWPNPASSRMNVTLEGVQANEAVLYDMAGRQVATYEVRNAQLGIDVSAMPAGIYMLRAGTETVKVAVRH